METLVSMCVGRDRSIEWGERDGGGEENMGVENKLEAWVVGLLNHTLLGFANSEACLGPKLVCGTYVS